MLCDPSTQNLPPGLLPLACLNGQGWRVSADKAGWINVQEQAAGLTNTQVQLQVEGGAWKGKMSFKATDYAAVDALDRMNGDQAAFLQAMTNQLGDWSAGQPTLSMPADPFTVAVEAPIQKTFNDEKTVYIKPVLAGAVLQNPFSAETREWPVNFPFKDNSSYVFQMPVPDGYTVAETPKDATIVFGTNKDLRFQYRCSVANNIITVTSKFQMNRLLFAAEEYAEIRRTYDLMVQKNQELIVLKKN